jgi:curved DNA-binding protein CbpA
MTTPPPKLRAGADFSRVSLEPDEILVISRVDGNTDVAALARLVARSPAQVEVALVRLVGAGLVDWAGAAGKVPPPRPPTGSGVSGAGRPSTFPARPSDPAAKAPIGLASEPVLDDMMLPRALLEEPGGLPPDLRRRIAWAHSKLGVWNHYEVLGLLRSVDDRELKRAYFERSKDWHPDRFKRFGELGTYRRMVDDVFKRVNEAYRELTAPDKRAAYDKTLPRPFDPTDIEALLRAEVEAEREARREDERRNRRLKQNPILARFARAKELYDEAVQLEKDRKLLDAMRTAQMAVTYDDRKPEYQELFARTRDAASIERVGPMLKRARHLESMTEWDHAIDRYQEIVEMVPGQAEARLRLAACLLYGQRPVSEVMPHAQRAVGLLPNEAEAHYILARCYEDVANEKGARRHYERALELRPGYAEAQKKLKRLRWGF